MKLVAIIPAHLASVRFPRKILLPLHGMAMIEHVRRRALQCSHIAKVIVATCDEEIAEVVKHGGGEVIMTSNRHKNGTSRAAEAISNHDCTHVILLQGDEPLLLPKHVDALAQAIKEREVGLAWNITAPLASADELQAPSVVKCAVGQNARILFCFRHSPSRADFTQQQKHTRKLAGIIGYKKEFLLKFSELGPGSIEQSEMIEQMRIIENGCDFWSVAVNENLPSINQPGNEQAVLKHMAANSEQQRLLRLTSATQSA